MNDPKPAPPNGVLVVDKPKGPTSHDIVAQARRYFRTKRVGHAGTLDPMASGVLLILLGEATKLSSALTLDRKAYQATVSFGTSTDSDDAQGKVVNSVVLEPGFITDDALNQALGLERTRETQLPPVVTAIKQDGMTAYLRLRKGLSVEVKPRDVRVFELSVLGRTETTVQISLSVSKGYYVRALARDLGAHLGIPSHLVALRRMSSGDFHVDEAIDWPPATPPKLLSVVETVKRAMPYVRLTNEGVERARVGKSLGAEHLLGVEGEACTVLGTCAWLSPDEELVALGQFDDQGIGRVQRGFCDPSAALAGDKDATRGFV